MNEFALIRHYFQRDAAAAAARAGVDLGIGDDCALLRVPEGARLAVSTDTLVSGRHFFDDVDAEALGHKSLAVNLSDLAAMGADPVACLLGLTLPVERANDDTWMSGFARGVLALADAWSCPLVGGDTTRGPLAIGVTVMGHVDAARALRRSSAQVGDEIYVSGSIGGAAWALSALQSNDAASAALALRHRLERPEPRVGLGRALLGVAHAAIDLSDGLAGDLRHLLDASRVGAVVDLEHLPLDVGMQALPRERAWQLALAGGDDYELCFTAPVERHDDVAAAAARSGVPVTVIGRIVDAPGIDWRFDRGSVTLSLHGYDHFA